MVGDVDGEGGSLPVEHISAGRREAVRLFLDRREPRPEAGLGHLDGPPRVRGGEEGDEESDGLHGAGYKVEVVCTVERGRSG